MMSDAFNRETFRPTGPHGWVQWKGANVCLDEVPNYVPIARDPR
jgi:hypothetical protein